MSAARDLLAGWRAQRARATVPEPADATEALAAQDIPSDPGALVGDDDPERQAMLAHYSAEPSDLPYRPDHPDPLRDGLLTGFRLRPLPAGHALEERQT
jgi:hypothetical protein